MPPFLVRGKVALGLIGDEGPLLLAPPPLCPDRTLTVELLRESAGLLVPEPVISDCLPLPLSVCIFVVGRSSLRAFSRLPALPVRFEGPKVPAPAPPCIRPAECVRLTLSGRPSDEGGRALIVPDLLFKPEADVRDMLEVGE